MPAEGSGSVVGETSVITGFEANVEKARTSIQAIHDEQANLVEVTVNIPHELHNELISSKGSRIRAVTQDCGSVHIKFPESENQSDTVTVRGSKADVEKAKRKLLEIAEDRELTSYTHELKVKPDLHRFVIGTNEANINRVREQYQVQIAVPSRTDDNIDTIVIIGRKENVEKAREDMEKLVKEMADMTEEHVSVPREYQSYQHSRANQLYPEVEAKFASIAGERNTTLNAISAGSHLDMASAFGSGESLFSMPSTERKPLLPEPILPTPSLLHDCRPLIGNSPRAVSGYVQKFGAMHAYGAVDIKQEVQFPSFVGFPASGIQRGELVDFSELVPCIAHRYLEDNEVAGKQPSSSQTPADEASLLLPKAVNSALSLPPPPPSPYLSFGANYDMPTKLLTVAANFPMDATAEQNLPQLPVRNLSTSGVNHHRIYFDAPPNVVETEMEISTPSHVLSETKAELIAGTDQTECRRKFKEVGLETAWSRLFAGSADSVLQPLPAEPVHVDNLHDNISLSDFAVEAAGLPDASAADDKNIKQLQRNAAATVPATDDAELAGRSRADVFSPSNEIHRYHHHHHRHYRSDELETSTLQAPSEVNCSAPLVREELAQHQRKIQLFADDIISQMERRDLLPAVRLRPLKTPSVRPENASECYLEDVIRVSAIAEDECFKKLIIIRGPKQHFKTSAALRIAEEFKRNVMHHPPAFAREFSSRIISAEDMDPRLYKVQLEQQQQQQQYDDEEEPDELRSEKDKKLQDDVSPSPFALSRLSPFRDDEELRCMTGDKAAFNVTKFIDHFNARNLSFLIILEGRFEFRDELQKMMLELLKPYKDVEVFVLDICYELRRHSMLGYKQSRHVNWRPESLAAWKFLRTVVVDKKWLESVAAQHDADMQHKAGAASVGPELQLPKVFGVDRPKSICNHAYLAEPGDFCAQPITNDYAGLRMRNPVSPVRRSPQPARRNVLCFDTTKVDAVHCGPRDKSPRMLLGASSVCDMPHADSLSSLARGDSRNRLPSPSQVAERSRRNDGRLAMKQSDETIDDDMGIRPTSKLLLRPLTNKLDVRDRSGPPPPPFVIRDTDDLRRRTAGFGPPFSDKSTGAPQDSKRPAQQEDTLLQPSSKNDNERKAVHGRPQSPSRSWRRRGERLRSPPVPLPVRSPYGPPRTATLFADEFDKLDCHSTRHGNRDVSRCSAAVSPPRNVAVSSSSAAIPVGSDFVGKDDADDIRRRSSHGYGPPDPARRRQPKEDSLLERDRVCHSDHHQSRTSADLIIEAILRGRLQQPMTTTTKEPVSSPSLAHLSGRESLPGIADDVGFSPAAGDDRPLAPSPSLMEPFVSRSTYTSEKSLASAAVEADPKPSADVPSQADLPHRKPKVKLEHGTLADMADSFITLNNNKNNSSGAVLQRKRLAPPSDSFDGAQKKLKKTSLDTVSAATVTPTATSPKLLLPPKKVSFSTEKNPKDVTGGVWALTGNAGVKTTATDTTFTTATPAPPLDFKAALYKMLRPLQDDGLLSAESLERMKKKADLLAEAQLNAEAGKSGTVATPPAGKSNETSKKKLKRQAWFSDDDADAALPMPVSDRSVNVIALENSNRSSDLLAQNSSGDLKDLIAEPSPASSVESQSTLPVSNKRVVTPVSSVVQATPVPPPPPAPPLPEYQLLPRHIAVHFPMDIKSNLSSLDLSAVGLVSHEWAPTLLTDALMQTTTAYPEFTDSSANVDTSSSLWLPHFGLNGLLMDTVRYWRVTSIKGKLTVST